MLGNLTAHPVYLFIVVFVSTVILWWSLCVLPSLLIRWGWIQHKKKNRRLAKPQGPGDIASPLNAEEASPPISPKGCGEAERRRLDAQAESGTGAVASGAATPIYPKGTGAALARQESTAPDLERTTSTKSSSTHSCWDTFQSQKVAGTEDESQTQPLIMATLSQKLSSKDASESGASAQVLSMTQFVGASSSQHRPDGSAVPTAIEVDAAALQAVLDGAPSPPARPEVPAPPAPLTPPVSISVQPGPASPPAHSAAREPPEPPLSLLLEPDSRHSAAVESDMELCDVSSPAHQPLTMGRVTTERFCQVLNEVSPNSAGVRECDLSFQPGMTRIRTDLFNRVIDEVSPPGGQPQVAAQASAVDLQDVEEPSFFF